MNVSGMVRTTCGASIAACGALRTNATPRDSSSTRSRNRSANRERSAAVSVSRIFQASEWRSADR